MITITQNTDKDVYEIRSPYDPTWIEIVKTISGRKWDSANKLWTIPLDKLGFLINAVSGTVYETQLKIFSNEDLGKNEAVPTTTTIPDIDISKIKLHVQDGKSLYQHQKDTIKYAVYRDKLNMNSGFVLADEPGLGKSNSVMNTALYHKETKHYKHCLIICCINTSKYNWVEDVTKHTCGAHVPYILGTRISKKGKSAVHGGKEKLADLKTLTMYSNNVEPLPYFIILNIEAVRYSEGRKYPIADRIIELCLSGEINMIAIDEIHKNCGMTSQQGKQILRIKKMTKSLVEWIPMTGTPITTSPLNCFLPFRLIDAHTTDSFYVWSQKYCVYGGFGGKEIVGYKNISELKSIVQKHMLRRLKKDVLDLPDKIHITEYVENSEYQKKLYKQVRGELLAQKGVIQASMNPLAQFIRLRQVNGLPEVIDKSLNTTDKSYLNNNAKMKRVLEIIDYHVSQGEKVVVYSNWVQPLRTLYNWIPKEYKTCVFTGTMKDDVRQQHKQAFIEDPSRMVLLGTIGALGTTHTLTSSHVAIFLEDCWNATDKVQAEDRQHRIGTTEPLLIYTVITKDTVDERVFEIMTSKQGIANFIIDDTLDLKKYPQLVDLLLSD